MKLVPLTNENPKRKMKMIITENQFRTLAENVLSLQEENQIKNTHLIKKNTNAKKKQKKNQISREDGFRIGCKCTKQTKIINVTALV